MYLRCPGYLFGSMVGIATITNPHQVKVCYLQNKVLVKKHILWFKISVKHIFAVEIAKPLSYPQNDVEHQFLL